MHSQLNTQWAALMSGLKGCSGPCSKAKPNKYCGSKYFFLQFWNTKGCSGAPAPFAQSHDLCGGVAHPGPCSALCTNADFHFGKIRIKIKLGNSSSVLIFSRISFVLLFRDSLKTFPQSPGFPLAPFIVEVVAQASGDLGEAYIKTHRDCLSQAHPNSPT